MRRCGTFSRKLAPGFAAMLDDVRGAVTATVMATETAAGAVDAGATQVAEVVRAFRQIAAQVATTVEATREIEPSTRPQASAVEQQGHVAIAGLAQATRETEAGATQILQTSSQSTSPTSLTRLIQPT
jgi:methyl-accepting chemotaxis protein